MEISLKLLGEHNARNALAAAAGALAIGTSLQEIKQGLETLEPVKGRLAPLAGLNDTLLVDDTYNANPSSAKAAIDVLAGFTAGEQVFVLGDMGELGDNVAELHQEVGEYARTRGIDQLYCLGAQSVHAASAFGATAKHFDALEPLLDSLKATMKNNMTILVKGSRSMRMERVIEALKATDSVNEGRN